MSETRSLVYQYACGVKCDFDDHAMHQLRLAHNFYNALVALWREHEEAKRQIWASHPSVGPVMKEVDDLDQQCEIAAEEWRKSKARTRDRLGEAEAKATLDDLRAQLKTAWSTLKKRKSAAQPELRPQWTEAKTLHYQALKQTRNDFASQGLYWGNYNKIFAYYQRASRAIEAKRNAGQRAELRFRRWSSQGQIAVQLQRQKDDPERTPDLLSSNDKNKWRGLVELPRMQDRKHRSPITIRTGVDANGEMQQLTVPEVIWHRPIPSEGDITDVVISRRGIASHSRLSVENTVKLPMPEHSKAPGICGINTGWRVLSDGSIRVAVWRAKNNDALRVPSHLSNAILLDGEGGEVRILPKYIGKWEYASEIRGERDRRLELLREELIKRWPQIRKPEELAETTIKDIKSWRAPNRFVRLARIFGSGSV